MDWKKGTCIVATLFLLCGADATVFAQETATTEQAQAETQDFIQTGIAEINLLLQQGKYAEVRTKCRKLLKESAAKGGPPFLTHYYSFGDIFRLQEKYAEEIFLLKDGYEAASEILGEDHTEELLRPIAQLCSAYQAKGDFAAAEPYLRRGEEILRAQGKEPWGRYERDARHFQTVELFQRIGQKELTPAEAQKEAKAFLEAGWIIDDRDKMELLDIVHTAAFSPHNFYDEVAKMRRSDYLLMSIQGLDQVGRMYCTIRAAYTYAYLLDNNQVADKLLEPLYQEIRQDYQRPRTQKEVEAMLLTLEVKGALLTHEGHHDDAITASEIGVEIYERALPSLSQGGKEAFLGFILGASESYKALGKMDQWNNIFERLSQDSGANNVWLSSGRVIQVFSKENSDDEEKRQALKALRMMADKTCSEKPDYEPLIRRSMQVLSALLPEPWSSIVRSEKDISSAQESAFGEKAYLSRTDDLVSAEQAYRREEFLKAASLYESLLEKSIAAGEEHGMNAMAARRGMAQSYCMAGKQAAREGESDRAETLTERGLQYYEALVDTYEEYRDEFSDLSREARRNWFAAVVSDYREAARHFSECPRTSGKYSYYMGKMFDTLEKCKARILLEQYAEQIADESGILTDTEVAKLQAYRQEIQNRREALHRLEGSQGNAAGELQSARKDVERAEKNERQYRETLQQKYPAYQTLSNPKILDSKSGQELLPPDTAFLTYSLHRIDASGAIDMVELLSMTENEVQFASQGQLAAGEEWAAYYTLLSYPDFSHFSKVYRLWKVNGPGQAAHYMVQERNAGKPLDAETRIDSPQAFEDVRKELANKWGTWFAERFANHLGIHPGMRLIISPDDCAPPIPFETLTCNGKSFADLYEISYTPSLSVYALMMERGEANSVLTDRKELFAMGDAVYSWNAETSGPRGDNFAPLSGLAKELELVGNLFPEDEQKTILQQEDASEPSLKALDESGELAQYKYLLFASHGVFDEENPMANAIVLSHPNKQQPAALDGYVTVREWMNYHLHSDLVYLSACETGRGTSYAGEGLISLPYALTIAGNKSTVMTLWEIEDEPSAEFSRSFFGRLAAGQPAVQALAETKREFLHHETLAYRDPHIWGAFQLYGE